MSLNTITKAASEFVCNSNILVLLDLAWIETLFILFFFFFLFLSFECPCPWFVHSFVFINSSFLSIVHSLNIPQFIHLPAQFSVWGSYKLKCWEHFRTSHFVTVCFYFLWVNPSDLNGCAFSFARSCHAFSPERFYLATFPEAIHAGRGRSMSQLAFGVVLPLNFSLPARVLVFPCEVNLHFPND